MEYFGNNFTAPSNSEIVMWRFLRNRRLILRLHTAYNFQGTHILAASRGHLSDSVISLFLVGAATSHKTFVFLKEGRFSPSRSSKVDKFGASRKRGVDFLLVRNSNFFPILHRFREMTGFMCYLPHPYSTAILGVFPLHQIADVGREPEQRP